MQYLKEYQGFSVNLAHIARILSVIVGGTTDKQSQLAEVGFGDNKVRGYKEYLKDFGLIGNKSQISSIGETVVTNDDRFREYLTKWLLIYNWSIKENNPFLYFLVNDYSGTGDDQDIIRKFKQWANRNEVKTDYEGTKLNGLINRTKSALTDSDAFKDLNFFITEDALLQRSEPYYVHIYIIAYIFYSTRNKRTSIGFRELLEEKGNFPKFFNLSSKELDLKIGELMNLGFARMIQHADLHMVEYTYQGDPLSILKRYYDEY